MAMQGATAAPAAAASATLTLLLPAADRCLQSLPESLAAILGRADRLADATSGRAAQLQRQFEILPRGWPVAALTRQSDAGDAAGSAWLRADPAWVRPDINGARMFACGDTLHPVQDDVDMLLPALCPLFGDAGFTLDAPTPSRWYLRMAKGSPMPEFAEPDEVLGADLFEHLPQTGQMDEATMRRWRALMSDVQVVLHNHPWNARRAAAGKPPINSLWFWGGGVLPESVVSRPTIAWSEDSLLRALASAANAEISTLPQEFSMPKSDALVDLRHVDGDRLRTHWLAPAFDSVRRRDLSRVELDCADGTRFHLSGSQRWRFWRRPLVFKPRTAQGA